MTGKELFQEAQMLFMSGRARESIDKFDLALAGGFDEKSVLLSRGAAYINTQEYGKALADLDQVLLMDPENERAHYYRGIVQLNLEDFEKAVSEFDAAIRKNPQRGPAFLGRGMALAEIGQEDKAIQDFKTAVGHSTAEVERFGHSFGNARTKFSRSMALLEGERGPFGQVLSPEEVDKLHQWLEPSA